MSVVDLKKGWCSNCRPGRHALCASRWCECDVKVSHPNRPEPVAEVVPIRPAPPTAHAEMRAAPMLQADLLDFRPRHYRAFDSCHRHKADARWAFRTEYVRRNGVQPHKAVVDEGVVHCPLDDSCRYGGQG